MFIVFIELFYLLLDLRNEVINIFSVIYSISSFIRMGIGGVPPLSAAWAKSPNAPPSYGAVM